LTFFGHSTVLLEVGGIRILTDPVLHDRVSLIRRVAGPLDPALYAGIDVALISHLHLDHFDVRSLRLLGPDVGLIVPRGAADLVRALGFRCLAELGAGDRLALGTSTLTATPAVHGGFRPPLGPRAAAVGYLIEDGPTRIYFAGDTGLFPGMADLSPGLDVALLPVWGWGPTLGEGHLDPAGAAAAVRLLKPRFAVPIHWGTLWPYGLGRVRPERLSDPPKEFSSRVAGAPATTAVLVTPPGETVTFVP